MWTISYGDVNTQTKTYENLLSPILSTIHDDVSYILESYILGKLHSSTEIFCSNSRISRWNSQLTIDLRRFNVEKIPRFQNINQMNYLIKITL